MWQTVKGSIEGLKNSPSCLAAVIMTGTLAYLIHAGRQAEEIREHERFMMILKQCDFIPETHGHASPESNRPKSP